MSTGAQRNDIAGRCDDNGEGIRIASRLDFTVKLPWSVWLEVYCALQHRFHALPPQYRDSRVNSLYALREIDRVARGAEELPPPDDVVGDPDEFGDASA